MWNNVKRREYELKYEQIKQRSNEYLRIRDDRNWTELIINPNLREHLDMVIQCKKVGIQPMKDTDIQVTTQQVKKQLSTVKLKLKKPLDQTE